MNTHGRIFHRMYHYRWSCLEYEVELSSSLDTWRVHFAVYIVFGLLRIYIWKVNDNYCSVLLTSNI